MVTDQQVRRLFQFLWREETLALAAAKAGMDEKTARKYRRLGRLPSEGLTERGWRTREDAFAEVWPAVREQLELNPGLQAKTLFAWLQRQYPGRFSDGQLRTLQRQIKVWRASDGPAKEVFFAQQHWPGRLSASDFTHATSLEVTIAGQRLEHLLYHFVLTYSNWEAASICFSESFESLSSGLQNALWQLGGVPQRHRSDQLSAAVQQLGDTREFTRRYEGLLAHYGLVGEKIQAGQAHENGDVEQSHRRFKEAMDQALHLRGSREFASRPEYDAFVHQIVEQRNAGRGARLQEELPLLRALPERRLEACKRVRVRVDSGSTIHVERNTYSVPSRLIGEQIEARLFMDHVELWYGQRLVERVPRLRGRGKQGIHYRHVIDWLVRKPGAFDHYRYREELFPSSTFRIAYDVLRQQNPAQAVKTYLQLLQLAARESESQVEDAVRQLLNTDQPITSVAVAAQLQASSSVRGPAEVQIEAVDLNGFDVLLPDKEVWHGSGDGGEGSSGAAVARPALIEHAAAL